MTMWMFCACSGLLSLRETASGEWERRRLCIGDSQMCPGADSVPPLELGFGQDKGGEIYLMMGTTPGISPATLYQIADPARFVCTNYYTFPCMR